MAEKYELIARNATSLMKPKLIKSKKVKITKSNFSAKLKNFANFSKSQNTGINIRVMGFLIFKAKIVFI